MKDFKTFVGNLSVNENLLVPRNIEGRKETLKQLNIKLLSQEVIDGDLILDESFMDIDPKFVKLKEVNGNIRLIGDQWTEIPEWLKDVEIKGNFSCPSNKLTSLKNCPQKIEGSFYCYNNQLISLEGCPKNIEGNFWCHNNKLTSLKGCPDNIEGDFYCDDNKSELELPDYVKLKGKFVNK
jgi:hypothetical protein